MTIKRKTRVDLNNTADKAGAKDILCVLASLRQIPTLDQPPCSE